MREMSGFGPWKRFFFPFPGDALLCCASCNMNINCLVLRPLVHLDLSPEQHGYRETCFLVLRQSGQG